MLAADQSAQAANVGVEHLKSAASPLAWQHVFGERRHRLAVAADQAAVAIEEQQRVVI
jgi:hypothetical protein